MNLWSHRFSPTIWTKYCKDFWPVLLYHKTEQKSFWFIFLKKRWLLKFILKFTALANKCGQNTCTFFIDLYNLCFFFSLDLPGLKTLFQFFLAVSIIKRGENNNSKREYRISSYSFRGNYSFLTFALCTVTFHHST